MSADDLLLLARLYSRATKTALTVISTNACGNEATLRRIAAGKTCYASTIERGGRWLSDHWPAGVEWPATVPRPIDRPVAEAAS